MKKIIILPLLVMSLTASPSFPQQLPFKYGLSAQAGTWLSTNGRYNADYKLRDLVDPGTAIGIGFSIIVNRHYSVEMQLTTAWLNYQENKRPLSGDIPAFSVSSLLFHNRYYLLARKISPYLSAGVGIYYWRFTEDGAFGKAQKFEGEELEKMSIGGNAGMGIRICLMPRLALIGEVQYHYILSKDEFFFGQEFSEQGLTSYQGGLRIYFNSIF